MRKQYHFRPSKNGYYAWDVDKLVERSKGFPVISVKFSKIKELDENFWCALAISVRGTFK